MPSAGEIKAVASILGDPGNDALSAEEVAERVIEAYEAQRAKTHNMIILGHFRLEDDQSYVAAVGPLSTRAVKAAREVGERFAWDYRTKRGTGRYVLVPLIRHPSAAWDALREEDEEKVVRVWKSVTPGVEATYEPMRFELPDDVRAQISADWDIDESVLREKFGPACLCGLKHLPERSSLGHAVTPGCPRHPEGSDGRAVEG